MSTQSQMTLILGGTGKTGWLDGHNAHVTDGVDRAAARGAWQ